ncbi:alpha-L-fucosidase [Niastella populi]|uniref:alpha-L-fucosidase n=1 Tax=Niastella populi TaxID=550983 RepID=A0A1V9F614_9BACT|nr:alpha-L-fucosidase [Niastella populi]OQP53646.1 alpha-L-fucosidase [Niastella populi]
MRIKRGFVIIICIMHSLVSPGQHDVVKDGEASEYNLNKPEREEWLRNSAAGLFIHFSVDAQLGIVISHSLVGASDDYVNRYFNELPKTFYPSRFDPVEIATLAKLAGMKYIMFTTKHHSGFCMWNTKTTGFNIMNTPYRKDLLKDFVEATRNAGLQVGFYFSPEDFHFLHTHDMLISRDDVVMTDVVKKEFDEFTRRQCEELMTNYGKIDLLFIDGEPKEVVKETCWKLQPDILITRGALKTTEQMLPGVTIQKPWLSCITIGTAWQFQPTNERYKSGTSLIDLLVEARSKGGSLLLNTGPKPDGAMVPEQENRLRELAAWYFINKEAVDSVQPWVISREKNIWFTTKNNKQTLYAIITGLPGWVEGDRKSFVLHSVKATAGTSISVLGQNGIIQEYKPGRNVKPAFQQTDTGLIVSVFRTQRIYDDHKWPNAVVVKLKNVQPAIEPVQVVTLDARSSGTTMALSGKILNFKPATPMKARFYYRPYHGQIEDLYTGPWIRSAPAPIESNGHFKATIAGLKKGQQYEFKAVAEYSNIELEGDKKLWTQ